MALRDLRCVPYAGCNIAVGTKVNQEIYPGRQMDGQTDKERMHHSHQIELFPETHTHSETQTHMGGFSRKYKMLWLQ